MHYYETVMIYFDCMNNIKNNALLIIKFLPFCFGFNHANNIHYTGKVYGAIAIYIHNTLHASYIIILLIHDLLL